MIQVNRVRSSLYILMFEVTMKNITSRYKRNPSLFITHTCYLHFLNIALPKTNSSQPSLYLRKHFWYFACHVTHSWIPCWLRTENWFCMQTHKKPTYFMRFSLLHNCAFTSSYFLKVTWTQYSLKWEISTKLRVHKANY